MWNLQYWNMLEFVRETSRWLVIGSNYSYDGTITYIRYAVICEDRGY